MEYLRRKKFSRGAVPAPRFAFGRMLAQNYLFECVPTNVHHRPYARTSLLDFIFAVSADVRQLDYFGQAINVAARAQGFVDSQAIWVTKTVVENPEVAEMLEVSKLTPAAQHATLRDVVDKMTIYQIPYRLKLAQLGR
jgi:hypothetical protein